MGRFKKNCKCKLSNQSSLKSVPFNLNWLMSPHLQFFCWHPYYNLRQEKNFLSKKTGFFLGGTQSKNFFLGRNNSQSNKLLSRTRSKKFDLSGIWSKCSSSVEERRNIDSLGRVGRNISSLGQDGRNIPTFGRVGRK